MTSPLIARFRVEFQHLFVNFYGERYRQHTRGTDKERLSPELRGVFGNADAPPYAVAQYLLSDERVAREIAEHNKAGSSVTLGQSEIPDHTYWPCRQLFIALSAMEPIGTCRMFVAELCYMVLWNDLTRRGIDPLAQPVAATLDMFRVLAEDSERANQTEVQEEIGAIYKQLSTIYTTLKGQGYADPATQPTFVAMRTLNWFDTKYNPLSITEVWFRLMDIVNSRHWVRPFVPLPTPALTSTDLGNIVKMLLLNDATRTSPAS